jgi:hypothetical protein
MAYRLVHANRIARELYGPDAVRRSRAPLGASYRIARLDGATAIVVCCSLTPRDALVAVADALRQEAGVDFAPLP